MQNYQIKVVAWVFALFSIANIKFCIVYSETIEDIRTKTEWQSPHHPDNDVFIPTITPAELIAYLDKYHKDIIRMQTLFNKISAQGLNVWIGEKNNKHKWLSERYISFSIIDPLKQVSFNDIYLFISKNNPDKDKLFKLSKNTKIIITGRVKDIDKGKAWIEVTNID